jgi:L-cysteine desulfidase
MNVRRVSAYPACVTGAAGVAALAHLGFSADGLNNLSPFT